MEHTKNNDQVVAKHWYSRFRWVLELLVVLAIIIAVRTWSQRNLVDGLAPEFIAQGLKGEHIELRQYRGHSVLLHFWMQDCSLCRLEQGSINDLAHTYPVITITYSDDVVALEGYLHEQGIEDWATIVDKNGAIQKQYGVLATPTNYIIDAEGRIRFREVGLSSGWGLKLRMWLAEHGF